jgi:tetratricopeptide (TPR) repeat protein
MGTHKGSAMLVHRTDSVDIRLQLETAASKVGAAKARAQAHEHEVAIALCTEAIALAPTSWQAYLERSVSELAVYRRDSTDASSLDSALRDAKRAAFMCPRSWRCALQRSRCLGASGRLDEAFAGLDEARALAAADLQGESSDEAAFALEDQCGRLQLEAAKEAKASGKLSTDKWLALFHRANRTLSKAIALKPTSAETLNNRGVAKYEAHLFDQAMADFELALKADPCNDRAMSNRGLVLRVRQQLEAAHASLSASIAQNPAAAISYNNLGCIERDLGRPLAALSNFSKAAEMEPSYAQAVANRNTVLSELRMPIPITPVEDVPIPTGSGEPAVAGR